MGAREPARVKLAFRVAVACVALLLVAGMWMLLPEPDGVSVQDVSADGAAAESDARPHERVRLEAKPADDGALPPEPAAPVYELRGTVIDAERRTPVTGAEVALIARGAAEFGNDVLVFDSPKSVTSVITGADGRFVLASAAEHGAILVKADGYPPTSSYASSKREVEVRISAAEARDVRVVAAEDGTPIAGARVALVEVGPWGRDSATLHALRTDNAGCARIRPSPRQQLVVAAPGRGTYHGQVADEVRLVPGLRLAGKVVDEEGSPVADAIVTAKVGSFGADGCRSSADGAFEFDPLARPGDIEITAAKAGHVRRTVVASAGDAGVQLVLTKLTLLTGIVTGPGGARVAGASVYSVSDLGASTQSGPSRPDGSFGLDVPRVGAVRVVASVGSQAGPRDPWICQLIGERQIAADEREETKSVTIRIAPPVKSYAALDVFDAAGTQLSVAHALPATELLSEQHEESGRLRLTVAEPPGTVIRISYEAHAQDGLQRPRQSAELRTTASEDAAPAVIVLPDHPRVRIRGVDPATGGTMKVHAMLELWELGEGEPAFLGGIGSWPDQSWSLDPQRRYAVTIAADRCLEVRREFTTRDAMDGVLDLPLPPAARIRGRLLLADGRTPPYNTAVSAGRWSGGSVDPATGRFDVAVGSPGEVTLRAGIHEVGTATLGNFTVSAPQILDVGDLRFPALVELRGRATDAAGGAVAGARLFWVGAGGSMEYGTSTDPSGAFVLRVPSGERGWVLAARLGLGAGWSAVSSTEVAAASHEPVRVTMPREGKLRLTVRGRQYGILLRAEGSSPEWGHPFVRQVGGSNRDGVYELRGLPPGRMRVFVWNGDRKRLAGEAEIRVGETAELLAR